MAVARELMEELGIQVRHRARLLGPLVTLLQWDGWQGWDCSDEGGLRRVGAALMLMQGALCAVQHAAHAAHAELNETAHTQVDASKLVPLGFVSQFYTVMRYNLLGMLFGEGVARPGVAQRSAAQRASVLACAGCISLCHCNWRAVRSLTGWVRLLQCPNPLP